MTVEFRNANSFREYPLRPFNDGVRVSQAANLVSNMMVDAQFDIFCDRVQNESETPPLVVVSGIDTTHFSNVDAYNIKLDISVGYGLRDVNDGPIQPGPGTPNQDLTTSRKWFHLSTIVLTAGDIGTTADNGYVYLWISDTGEEFDKDPKTGYSGSKVYVTGYIVLDVDFLRKPPTVKVDTNFIDRDRDIGSLSLHADTPIFEEGVVTTISTQLTRTMRIANLESIPAPGKEKAKGVRDVVAVVDGNGDVETFYKDVKFEEGNNCRVSVNSSTDVVTIIPAVGAGKGQLCGDSDPGSSEEACNDFIYSINGIKSKDSGLQFQGVAPLQIFQGDPAFTEGVDYTQIPHSSDYIDEGTFWQHALIFRVGAWGPDDDTPCETPCPS